MPLLPVADDDDATQSRDGGVDLSSGMYVGFDVQQPHTALATTHHSSFHLI
jgi:hypothetical protein